MDECLVIRLEITGNVETKCAPVLISKGTLLIIQKTQRQKS